MDLAGFGPSYVGIALAGLFVVVALAEQAWPAWRAPIPAGPRWIANLGLYACSEALSLALLPGMTAVAVVSLASIPKFTVAQDPVGTVFHWLAVVLALDLAYYLLHRLCHAWALLWRLHAVHHTDVDLDVTSAVRHHPLELVPIIVVTATVGALVGATPGEIAGYGLLAFGVQLLAHANVRLPDRLAAMLARVVVTPAFHRLHHSRDERECDANYGEVLVVWDRLFGSLASRADGMPTGFGVAAYHMPRFQRFGWMLLQPLVRPPHPTTVAPPPKVPVLAAQRRFDR